MNHVIISPCIDPVTTPGPRINQGLQSGLDQDAVCVLAHHSSCRPLARVKPNSQTATGIESERPTGMRERFWMKQANGKDHVETTISAWQRREKKSLMREG